MPPAATKKKVEQELKSLGISRNKAPVSQFCCPLCNPGDSLGGGKNGGMFVIVGVPDNDGPVAWDNLPVKLNKGGVDPEDFPVKFRIGVRRRVLRRHMQTFHASQVGTAEYEALANAWQYNNAGGAKPKASVGVKSAPAEPKASARGKSAPARGNTKTQHLQKGGEISKTNGAGNLAATADRGRDGTKRSGPAGNSGIAKKASPAAAPTARGEGTRTVSGARQGEGIGALLSSVYGSGGRLRAGLVGAVG